MQSKELRLRDTEEKLAKAAEVRKWNHGGGAKLVEATRLWMTIFAWTKMVELAAAQLRHSKAVEKLRQIFLPPCLFWKARRLRQQQRAERDILTAKKHEDGEFTRSLTISNLPSQVSFFEGWGRSALRVVISNLKPEYFEPSEVIIMEGDWGHSQMRQKM
eukprot:TRINITY_DN9087_c0_g1_i2.p1 TRINITY_DN9087_c0_g1~~TRINITY_DN9087_c0_g1_i2.p1  ORF type:complete len:160 (-),score=37.54 TRINITY_DN9087_c0_g1_i2:281-760(-)